MKITSVSASVRFSKAIQPGCYKTVELSAEGTLNPNENWHEAQATLYTDLGDQLKALWSTRSDQSAPTEQHNEHEYSNGTVQAHYCSEHGIEYCRYEKENQVWYAHKSGNSWCREKA